MCNLKNSDRKVLLEKHDTIWQEIMCHLPLAIFSVAFSMIVLSFLSYFDGSGSNSAGAHRLFHNFHFLHLLFAGTGTVLTFRRYSRKIVMGIFVGYLIPFVFCTLSDAILPYLGGELLGVDMHFHWCFISHIKNVLPFLLVGMLNGWVMSGHSINKQLFYSQGFHFLHIFISSMASILYLVSFGFSSWYKQMGIVFIFLILAVLIPCTLSDIVVPVLFAKKKRKACVTCAKECANETN
jgi:hypothetical protein